MTPKENQVSSKEVRLQIPVEHEEIGACEFVTGRDSLPIE